MDFDFEYALSIVPHLLNGALVTIQATFFGMLFSIFGGAILAIARLSRNKLLSYTAVIYVEFFRLTPLLVQLFFLFYVLPQFGIRLSGLATGIIGLGLHFSAYTAEVFRAAIGNIPKGQWEAAIALNYTPMGTWRHVILPQTPPIVIPVLAIYTIGMFKETALLATITVNELLGTALQQAALSFRYLEAITMVGLLFLLMSMTASLGAQFLENYFKGQ